MGMILRIASSRIVGQGDIVGRSGYFSLNLSANSVMRGRLDARRTLKSLVADLRLYKDLPKSGKIRGWIYSVHVGSWGGMTTRILTCLVSLLGTIFAITGYYFWIKKQFRKLR